ncbi:MAG: PAS domain-containing protein [Defluviitaleaceae bacterium]|nr:PAS domain-containing protein [Defluviitaleaceae bacterium]MCL2836322.1 PAS domain-containing protein [Defluviitaleaceae bacterium]
MFSEDNIEQSRTEDREALFQSLKIFSKIVCGDITSLDALADDVIGIGMGEQGYYKSKSEIKELLEKAVRAPGEEQPKISFEYENIDIRFSAPGSAILTVEIYVITEIDGQISKNGVMQMASAKKENGRWLFNLLTAVPLELSEESIESYPLAFADETLAKLKGELQTETFDMMNESFSGGILGTYIKEGYPLYFANDALIEMFGYERDEFYEKFKDNTAQLAYKDDKEHIREISEESERSDGENVAGRARFVKKDGSPMWAESRIRKTKDDYGNDIFLSVLIDVTEVVNLHLQADEQNKMIMESINYASKIQKNLLPLDNVFEEAFSDYSVIWKPRDIVGGDIYWAKNFDGGTVLCVCDCTGHGTPGALLTMLVVSAFESIITEKRYKNTAEILYMLDQRLASVLNVRSDVSLNMDINDGCDLAVLFIAKDGGIAMSSGNINVFACDGKEVTRYKGQSVYIGEGRLKSKEEVKTIEISANPNNKFYIASDGLYDQIGGKEKRQFGYSIFKDIILNGHNGKQAAISGMIWDAFEEFRGEEPRRDDFELITFQPKILGGGIVYDS